MSFKTDKLYGRRGGGWKEAPAPESKPVVTVVAAPAGPKALRRHLMVEHRIPTTVLDEHSPKEWANWHTAEHKHRLPEFLRHRHDAPAPIEAAEGEHAGRLRAARDGKLPASITQEVIDRAAYAAKRRAEGLPVSPYDRECSEVAQEIAARAARKARKGRAA